jgi:hypothetical protein
MFGAVAVAFCVRYAVSVVIAGDTLPCGCCLRSHISPQQRHERSSSPDEAPTRRPLRKRIENLILVVIDGITPERAQQAARGLTATLTKRRICSIRSTGGGPSSSRTAS